jgi:hypothetical protein
LGGFFTAMKGVVKMNRQKLSQQVMWAILIPLLLVGCGAPAATPTSEPSPEPVVEVGDVIFDGTECTVSGSTELPPGRYSFVLKDQSELEVNLFVSRLTDGKTFQDLLDLQSEPGEYVPEQDWIDHAVELGSAWNKPDGGKVHTYIFIEEDALSQLAPQDRLSTPEQTLRDAKVRWPAKKAKWLDRNYKRIEKMGGLAAAKAALFGRPGREEKIKFLMSFTGIGPKYARNLMMDAYHPDFRSLEYNFAQQNALKNGRLAFLCKVLWRLRKSS